MTLFGPKNAPFPRKNDNLTNGTYITRPRVYALRKRPAIITSNDVLSLENKHHVMRSFPNQIRGSKSQRLWHIRRRMLDAHLWGWASFPSLEGSKVHREVVACMDHVAPAGVGAFITGNSMPGLSLRKRGRVQKSMLRNGKKS